MNKKLKVPLHTVELSWDELHPIDYCHGPSKEDIEWLKKKIANDEKHLKFTMLDVRGKK